jgi:hypothetical protein
MDMGGEFFGRNPGNAPPSDSEEDESPAEQAKAYVFKERHHEEEDLNAFVATLRKGGPEEFDEDADDDFNRAEFMKLFEAELAKEQKKTKKGPATVAAVEKDPVKRAFDKFLGQLDTTRGTRVKWDYAASYSIGGATIQRAAAQIDQLEAAIQSPVPPTERTPLVFWSAAARPPWSPIAAARILKPVPLETLCTVVEEHFGVACSGLLVMRAAPTHRVALLTAWNIEQAGHGLAFILQGATAEALSFSGVDGVVHPLGDLTRGTRAKACWHYVGATPVSLVLVHAARSAVRAFATNMEQRAAAADEEDKDEKKEKGKKKK